MAEAGGSAKAREEAESDRTMTSLTTITSTVTASFLASFVEVVEAFTIILAVGLSRGWRPARAARFASPSNATPASIG